MAEDARNTSRDSSNWDFSLGYAALSFNTTFGMDESWGESVVWLE